MQNEFFIITNIIKEEFKYNSFKTLLPELSKLCKNKNSKNQLKFLLLKIKIDIENTELKIIEKLGKYYNSLSAPFFNEPISNIKKSALSSFTSSNSTNNSLIDKLLLKNSNNTIDDKNLLYISHKSLYSYKYKSNSNSNENIFNNFNKINTDSKTNKIYKDNKKRSNSHSSTNLIKVTKKNSNKNYNNKKTINKNIIEVKHQIDFSIKNIKESCKKKTEGDINYNINKELSKEIIEFIDTMKLLQENIINKSTNIKTLKYSFEKKKNNLYEKACDIFNANNINDERIKNNTLINENNDINTNYFNKTIEIIKNNFQNTINNLNNEIHIYENKIKEKDNILKENDNIKKEYLDSIINIYNLLISLNHNNYNKEKEDSEINKTENKFNWYIEQITTIVNSMKLNNSNTQNIINISNISKENLDNENNTKEINNKDRDYNNLDYNNDYDAIIEECKKEVINKEDNEQLKNLIFENIIEIISLIFPVINGCIEKENESLISKLREDYEQQGIEFIFYLLKSYIKQLINLYKENQRQSHYKENSNANKETNCNTNTNSSKENDIYMQNIQKKFTIIDRNNTDVLFEDEKPNINLNFNLNYNTKGIKTPNQIIKNICKEIDNRSNNDIQNKIYSTLSFIKNNLFIKIEAKENEKIEQDNKIKDLLRINKEIKNNILSNENNIFLKKYNLLNSLYNEAQEKIKILEIEYLTLIKDLCTFIQNGDKIILKLDKLFNKYNNKLNNDSMKNEQYDLE